MMEIALDMTERFSTLATIISNRRTIKPMMMNGQPIADNIIEHLLALADWAPTHGNTEPWRFYWFAGNDKVIDFCHKHAALYQSFAGENAEPGTIKNLSSMGDKAAHLLITVMRRGDMPKIPEVEEIAATSAAIQNILLGATALNIATYWGTGGMMLKQPMKDFLQLRDQDIVLGAIYLGHTDTEKTGQRRIPIAEKVTKM
jgi:nitroreductase